MKKTVFRRFLFFSLCIALACFIIVCGILSFPVSEMIVDSKRSTLESNTDHVAKFIGSIESDTLVAPKDTSDIIASALSAFSRSMRAEIIVVTESGEVVYSTEATYKLFGAVLAEEVMEKISDGSHFEHGTLHNIYDKPYYISVSPINAGEGDSTIGYCVLAQENLWSSDRSPSLFLTIVVIVFLSALVIFILSSVYAYNTTRPLKQMADAAKRFAVGDFESRVHIKTNDEIHELADAFNEMADSLASSEGMRRNFVANVSHELKTPMTTIAGYIDGILDGTISKDEEDRYLAIVSKEIKRLSRLVTSMISLSKIDSGEIIVNRTEFVIEDTLFGVLQGFEQELLRKDIQIEGLDNESDTYVYGDRDLIYQVLYNLVENAVKFTDDGGYIRFSFKKNALGTFVCIENSGSGILPEDLRLVFDKFYKGDKSRSKNKNSMGLGLYIVRTIIHLHGGNITVESEPGEFCRFTFVLPDNTLSHHKKKELPKTITEDKV